MSKSALKAAYERALALSDEAQDQIAGLMNDLVDQHVSELRLSPEQIEEVRRRLADPNAEYVGQEEVFAEIGKLLREDKVGYSVSESALKIAYEKALSLPEEDQVEAAELLDEFVEQRTFRLTEEQQSEVRRRLADPNPVLILQEEVFARLRKRLGI